MLSRSSSLSRALEAAAAAAAAAAAVCLRIRLLVDVTCFGSGCRFGGGFGASRFRPALQWQKRNAILMSVAAVITARPREIDAGRERTLLPRPQLKHPLKNVSCPVHFSRPIKNTDVPTTGLVFCHSPSEALGGPPRSPRQLTVMEEAGNVKEITDADGESLTRSGGKSSHGVMNFAPTPPSSPSPPSVHSIISKVDFPANEK